jgi:prepilin-type N-terminal cleavage/methylation domain-containing protein
MRFRRPHRRGFFLIELLIVLILFAVFALLEARLFHSTMKLSFRATRSQNDTAAFDSGVAVMRADVWGAGSIKVIDPQRLVITRGRPGVAEEITWSIAGTDLVRGDGQRASHWPIPPGCTFAADGPAVVLAVAESSGQRGGQVRLVNESQLVTRLTAP